MQPTTTARVLIWMAAAMLPIQMLPAAPCGCAYTACKSQKDTTGQSCCCSAQVVREGCCSWPKAPRACCCCSGQQYDGGQACSHRDPNQVKPDCTCGANCPCGPTCHCGETESPTPSLPPARTDTSNDSTHNVVSIVQFNVSMTSCTRRFALAESTPDATGSLGRCASLCRFVL